MTDRSEEIEKRLAGLDDIGQVTGALRAMAASHLAAANAAMTAISTYAETIGRAVEAAEAAAGTPCAGRVEGPGMLIVIGASQGFSGAYPSRIAAAARQLFEPDLGVIVAGQRTVQMLEDDDQSLLWSADLPGHPDATPDLASRITDILVENSAEHPGAIRAIVGASDPAAPPVVQTLLPRPSGKAVAPTPPPVMTMAPKLLLDGLQREALFASIALMLMKGIRAEAQARIETMARAQTNLRRRRTDVEWSLRQARQEQMTTEMIELATSQLGTN